MTDPHAERILILDFGGQYTQLIARRVREAGVYCELHPHDIPVDEIRTFAPRGIIFSGGPESVTGSETPRASPVIFELNVPILGICYGMQLLAAEFGGAVDTSAHREFGHAQVRVRGRSRLLSGIADKTDNDEQVLLDVWMSHGDRVARMPPGFEVVASTDNAPLAAISDERRGLYGVQFHPEVTHTKQGQAILQRFVHDICGCGSLWTSGNIIENLVESVRTRVANDTVLLALSGGVDSSVVAALLHRAIGDQLTCIFVDNGLLRLNEADQVIKTFSEHMGIKLVRVEAEKRFLSALAGIVEPEEKRRIIGRLFIEVFEEHAQTVAGAKWLAQGTIYPDVIESAGAKTGKAHVIKTHHNVGGLPERLHLQLLEPLRELFKDEVRRIGEALGLPHELVYRHPFPGPGLGVRILGEVKKEYADLLRQADAIYLDELRRNDLYDKVSQAFAVFLPVRSVGVVGDQRAYEYVVALRAVETVDFMTANWANLPADVLATVSRRIINEVRGISRVVYDVSSKPPATIEWE
ncbi:MAG: glutamine-hydrolyzing GMP synthase [Acidiferrobacterales bacterium]